MVKLETTEVYMYASLTTTLSELLVEVSMKKNRMNAEGGLQHKAVSYTHLDVYKRQE